MQPGIVMNRLFSVDCERLGRAGPASRRRVKHGYVRCASGFDVAAGHRRG